MEDLAVAAFYPFAFSRLWRETRSTMERAGDAVVGVSSPLIATLGPVVGLCWCDWFSGAFDVTGKMDDTTAILAHSRDLYAQVDPKLQLNQIALGGAGEGGKLLVGFDQGVEVAAVG